MHPFVPDPASSSLLAGLRGGFMVHAEDLMDSVVRYMYSMFHVDYSFQINGSQPVLVVGFKDHSSLLQVYAASEATWLLEGGY